MGAPSDEHAGEVDATNRDHDTLTRMFRPRGIAIVGASEQPLSLGTRYLGGLIRYGYAGGVYPVNPKYDTVMGLPCYGSMKEVPGDCDTAVLAVSESKIEQAVIDCAERGLAGVIVFAAGYRETGPEGAEKERRLVELARDVGIRVVGPNSPGFINFIDKATVTATSVAFREDLAVAGTLGVVAQSGGVAGIIAERAMDRSIGLSYMLCSGNEADFDTPEAIEYLVDDPNTTAIAVYQEGVNDADRLVRAWERAAAAGKPVVTYAPGGNSASRRAASAHTGSLVGDDAVFDGVARELGVVRAYDLDDMLELASVLPKLPERDYENVLILTTSGGGAVLAADALGRAGMDLPELAPEIQEGLREELAEFGVFHNPVDMTSDFVQNPPSFRKSIELVCQSSDHDVVVLVITVQRPEFARTLADMILATPESRTCQLIVMWYAGAMSDEARGYLRTNGVAVIDKPSALAATLAGARLWNRRSRDVHTPRDVDPERPAKALIRPADAAELFGFLAAHGAPVAAYRALTDRTQLHQAAAAVSAPWVLKTASTTAGRKSDAGAVRLGLAHLDELEGAFGSVRDAADELGANDVPLLLQAMVPVGFELLLSITYDPAFGLAAVLGIGGRMTELHRRVAVGRPPLDGEEVRALLEETGLTALIDGFRDLPRLDPDELARVANGLAAAAKELLAPGGILEVNPLVLRADGEGLVCIDVRIDQPVA
jgi:acyl-CoA synthetase (NDP forming)